MTFKIGEVVAETEDYQIVVTEGWAADGAPKTGEYSLINKLYGVVEAATPMLPQVLQYIDQMQASLDASRAEKEMVREADGEVAPNVTSIH